MPTALRPVIGAYHVALFPGWRELVREQASRLIRSGLLERTSRLIVGVVGDDPSANEFLKQELGPRAEIRHFGDVGRYEFPTLHALYEAAAGTDSACWYLHTKGVSSGSEGARIHRLQMESIVVDNHRQCLEVVDSVNACGIHWRTDGFGQYRPHFSGNFWWANARYLRTLESPLACDQSDRYQAEFWIGSNPEVRVFEFVPAEEDPFARPSAWIGLEAKYREFLKGCGPIHRIVEIGVDYGYSLFHFARDYPAAELVGVDTFELHNDAEAWVRSHLSLFPNVRLVKGSSVAAGNSFSGPIDLLHIDGDHAFEGVARDFCAWSPHVRPGGCVMFHDVESFPSVRLLFDSLSGRKHVIPEHHGLGFWYKQ